MNETLNDRHIDRLTDTGRQINRHTDRQTNGQQKNVKKKNKHFFLKAFSKKKKDLGVKSETAQSTYSDLYQRWKKCPRWNEVLTMLSNNSRIWDKHKTIYDNYLPEAAVLQWLVPRGFSPNICSQNPEIHCSTCQRL